MSRQDTSPSKLSLNPPDANVMVRFVGELNGNLKFIVSETILFRDASSISFPENFEMHSNAISSFDKFDNSSINSVSREGIVSGKYKPLSKGIPVSTASLKLTFVLLSIVL